MAFRSRAWWRAIAVATAGMSFAGCVANKSNLVRPPGLPPVSASNAPRSAVATKVLKGVVVSSKDVLIEVPKGSAPSPRGALGVIGNPVAAVRTIGQAVAPAPDPVKGEEVAVQLESGEVIFIVQERTQLIRMQPGEKVSIVSTTNQTTKETSARIVRSADIPVQIKEF